MSDSDFNAHKAQLDACGVEIPLFPNANRIHFFPLGSLGANACCTSGDYINNCPLPLNATRFITPVNLRASAQVSACETD